MQIVQASKAYFPHLGGIETVLQQLAEGFAARQHGSHVVVCHDARRTIHEICNDVALTRVATLARVSSLPISPTYPLHLLQQSGDILQIHEPSLLPALSYVLSRGVSRRRFKRLVVWWHSDIVRQRVLAPLYTPLLQTLLREADAIVAATPKHISSSPMLSAVAAKCHVIHYGVDPARFVRTPAIEQEITQIQARYGRPIVLFSGRLVYYKGVEYLVEAMRYVPEAQLVVVGKGPLLPELQRLSANGYNNVTFIPHLDEAHFVAMYHACEIFVLPSVEPSEGFGIVQLEAMACARPVITSDLPTGVTYVNQDGRTGLVVPRRNAQALANAIRMLLANPELCQHLGATARDRVLREFTVDQMVDRTLTLYQSLLDEPSQVAAQR